ncbi:MAG: hypothetical protein VYA34_12765 [Myxococcota bacterium]|nr:hypothetical protein [Myxococcota bacterium]
MKEDRTHCRAILGLWIAGRQESLGLGCIIRVNGDGGVYGAALAEVFTHFDNVDHQLLDICSEDRGEDPECGETEAPISKSFLTKNVAAGFHGSQSLGWGYFLPTYRSFIGVAIEYGCRVRHDAPIVLWF